MEPHITPCPCHSTLPHPGSQGDTTHRDLMSVGLDPPQMAARWPLPQPQSHLCCGWKGRGGKWEALGVGFTSHQPGIHLALSWLLTSLKCPLSPDGSLYPSHPHISVLLRPNSWPGVVAWLVAPSPLLKWELRRVAFHCRRAGPFPPQMGVDGWGRGPPEPTRA